MKGKSFEIYEEVQKLIDYTFNASHQVGVDNDAFTNEYMSLTRQMHEIGKGKTALEEHEKIERLNALRTQFRELLKQHKILKRGE
jgi:predicted RNase H-related nuclease YkuK (DUF458 family)